MKSLLSDIKTLEQTYNEMSKHTDMEILGRGGTETQDCVYPDATSDNKKRNRLKGHKVLHCTAVIMLPMLTPWVYRQVYCQAPRLARP